MKYEVLYTKTAKDNLRIIDRQTAGRIVKKIGYFAKLVNPLSRAKKLKPPLETVYRFRIGDYRALFEINSQQELTILVIFKIAHRKDVYDL